jgi:branched-chain amino acid transport system permease protein
MSRYALLAIVVVLALVPPILGSSGSYFTRLAVIGLLYVASATAWDLVGGLTGQVSFGHAAFFGVGAFVTAILVRAGVPVMVTLVPAALAAAAYAALWGWPCLRLRGPFFAIATIGVGEATRLAALLWEPVTGGATGLTLPIGRSSPLAAYYLALALAMTSIGVAMVVRRSRLGLGLACIREDVDAAESIGIRTGWVQVQVLMISAAIVGIAGSVYAMYLFYVEPGDVFAFNRSIGLILMAIIGGVNSLWGPPIGAILFLGLEQILAAWFPAAHLGIYGLLLILMMLFEPRGLWALLTSRLAPERAQGRAGV